ncbi:AP-1 complex subunit gamma-1 [Coccomyxa sp. Obi]|nr:AP-1 complex subunit gamma-1 [Coccomyxa sp. Obi]
MSVRLRELIRSVRQCKTAAEERNVIAKESAALRNAFQEQDTTYRHRNVAKLMYIHMLGYPTHFGQMETLKLIAASGFAEKRMGYLGLMILLDERQEVLMLVTNSLKNDLNARNQYIVGLALCALGNICSAEMARDLTPELERLLQSSNSYIRKKAALCCIRVIRKVPESVEAFQDAAAKLLADRHHGVLLTGVTLMLEVCAVEPAAIEAYRRHVPSLCKVLRSLLMSGFAPEHDVSGITDPFLQIQVLRLLRVLGAGSASASDAMSDILAQVATNTEGTRNAGNAILYECVQTIMGVESSGGLRVLAINILGRFLANKDNNMRYVALNILARVVSVDLQAVQRHRSTVVDCVKDADVSIRRRALDLVYALVNEGNITALTKELLDYLKVADAEFKPDLTAKIAALVQRFAPDKRWHFDSLLQVMTQAGGDVKEEVWRAFIVLLTNAPELHAYAARSLFRALRDNLANAELSLLATATWYIGEYGELLVRDGPLLDKEEPLSVSAADVVGLLESLLNRPGLQPQCRNYTLTALMKLSTRFPDQADRIKALLAQHKGSAQLESQARAVEYGQIFQYGELRTQLLEHMPPLDAAAYARSAAAAGTLNAAPAALAPTNGNVVKDLLSLDDDDNATPGTAPGAAGNAFMYDLLGGLDAPAAASGQPAAAAAPLDLLSLLDDPAPAASTSGAASQQPLDLFGLGSAPAQAAAPASDPLADLGASFAVPAAAAAPAFPPVTVFDKDGVRIGFAFSKPPGQPATTDITATFTNSGAAPVTGFSLQAAVPKFMQLKLDPASGSTLAPMGAGNASQQLHVTNSMHGQKPLVMRLRIAYTLGTEAKLEQVEVKNFPAGL